LESRLEISDLIGDKPATESHIGIKRH
jgi:hypothetical protein